MSRARAVGAGLPAAPQGRPSGAERAGSGHHVQLRSLPRGTRLPRVSGLQKAPGKRSPPISPPQWPRRVHAVQALPACLELGRPPYLPGSWRRILPRFPPCSEPHGPPALLHSWGPLGPRFQLEASGGSHWADLPGKQPLDSKELGWGRVTIIISRLTGMAAKPQPQPSGRAAWVRPQHQSWKAQRATLRC